jgi:hypothetical protein
MSVNQQLRFNVARSLEKIEELTEENNELRTKLDEERLGRDLDARAARTKLAEAERERKNFALTSSQAQQTISVQLLKAERERNEAREQLAADKAFFEGYRQQAIRQQLQLQSQLAAEREAGARMREALRQYADAFNWDRHDKRESVNDWWLADGHGYELAKQALAASEATGEDASGGEEVK